MIRIRQINAGRKKTGRDRLPDFLNGLHREFLRHNEFIQARNIQDETPALVKPSLTHVMLLRSQEDQVKKPGLTWFHLNDRILA